MTIERKQLLETLLSLHDESGEPVSVARLASHLAADSGAVREQLDALQSRELVKDVTRGGYRPTVTARELLELDVDDETFLIVELPEEAEGTDE